MSTVYKRKVNTGCHHDYEFRIEEFDTAFEVAKTCDERKITSSSFDDERDKCFGSWEGVDSYDEALELLRNGYQPTVESMRGVFKATSKGDVKRYRFESGIVGENPIVPMALKGLPNSMISMKITPIKAKVLNVYYDMTDSCGVDSDDIIDAGKNMLGAVIELEKQGYRFNLYAVQSYSDSENSDMLIVKIKNSRQPLDLKRISFPMTHTAFFRVIGFDWYSKFPNGRYRSGYGHALRFEFNHDEMKELGIQLFGSNSVLMTGSEIRSAGDNVKEYIKEKIDGNCKVR